MPCPIIHRHHRIASLTRPHPPAPPTLPSATLSFSAASVCVYARARAGPRARGHARVLRDSGRGRRGGKGARGSPGSCPRCVGCGGGPGPSSEAGRRRWQGQKPRLVEHRVGWRVVVRERVAFAGGGVVCACSRGGGGEAPCTGTRVRSAHRRAGAYDERVSH